MVIHAVNMRYEVHKQIKLAAAFQICHQLQNLEELEFRTHLGLELAWTDLEGSFDIVKCAVGLIVKH